MRSVSAPRISRRCTTLPRAYPPSLSATAQSLYSGGVWGLFLGGGLLAAGFLYEAAGSDAYFAMAVPAFAGAGLAWYLSRRSVAPSTPARSDYGSVDLCFARPRELPLHALRSHPPLSFCRQ